MATSPIICPAPNLNGFLFERSSLILEESSLTNIFDLSLYSMDLTSYAKTRYNLKPEDSFLLAQSDIGDKDGYVRFIAFTVKYPIETTTVNKFINWTYSGKTNNLGEIMILSGDRIDSELNPTTGWNLSYDNGIIIENPHPNLSVEIEILVAR